MSIVVDQHVFLRISGVLYVGLATNVLVALGAAPALLIGFVLGPDQAVLPFALALVVLAPTLMAAFQVFRLYSDEGSVSVIANVLAALRRHAGPSLLIGTVLVLILGVLAVDIAWAWNSPRGALVVPLLAVGVVAAIAVGMTLLVARLDLPDTPLRTLARASVYLVVRSWHLTVLSLVGLVALVSIVAINPAMGLGFATAPLLYLVWANTRYTLAPILRKA